MKELSIKEKAKAYDEALEKARCYYKGANGNEDIITMTTTMFPELKESEDDKVRKKLIHLVKKSYEQGGYALGESDEMLAWLEKQGRQKPWSEEDEKIYQSIMDDIVQENQLNDKQTNWLRDIKYRYFPQPKQEWKPSDEMLEALYRVIPENVMEKSEDEMLLDKLYQGLKYGKVLSEK